MEGSRKNLNWALSWCGVTFTMLNNVKANLKYELKI